MALDMKMPKTRIIARNFGGTCGHALTPSSSANWYQKKICKTNRSAQKTNPSEIKGSTNSHQGFLTSQCSIGTRRKK